MFGGVTNLEHQIILFPGINGFLLFPLLKVFSTISSKCKRDRETTCFSESLFCQVKSISGCIGQIFFFFCNDPWRKWFQIPSKRVIPHFSLLMWHSMVRVICHSSMSYLLCTICQWRQASYSGHAFSFCSGDPPSPGTMSIFSQMYLFKYSWHIMLYWLFNFRYTIQ